MHRCCQYVQLAILGDLWVTFRLSENGMDRMSSGLEVTQGCSFGSETVDNHGGNLCFLKSLGASGGKVARVTTGLRRFGQVIIHDDILSRLVGCVCGLFVTLPLLITQAVMLLMDQKSWEPVQIACYA